jgi:hypothetical protein
MIGWSSTGPRSPSPTPGCLTLVLCSQGFSSVALNPWPCLCCSGHFRGLSPLRGILRTWGLFNPKGFTVEALPQDACFAWAWPPAIVARVALPHGPPLPCVGHQAWTPLSHHLPGCKISARMTLGRCRNTSLRNNYFRSHMCNSDLRDVVWRTRWECQCTTKSTPVQCS